MTLDEQITQITDPMEFVRLCNALLTAEHEHNFQVVDGTRGDEGNDGYVASEELLVAIYCPIKPERRTDQDYLAKIKNDLAKIPALRETGAYSIKRWVFVTPRKLSNKVLSAMKVEAEKVGIGATHFESTYLTGLLLKHKHLVTEFPGLLVSDIGEKLEEILSLIKSKPTWGRPPELTLNHDIVYEPETKDSPELARLHELRDQSKAHDNIPELRSIYYRSTDAVVQLNALIGIIDLYIPVQDDAEEMIHVCEMGMQVAKRVARRGVEAYFLVWKGYFLSFIHSELDMRTACQIRTDNLIGIQTVSDAERGVTLERLSQIRKEYGCAFAEALEMAMESNDPYIIASVLICCGNAAAQRAIYLWGLGIKELSLAEKKICKVSIMAARDIYVSMNDEFGATNALFNLANNIRFLGEEKEAYALAKVTIEVATKYGDDDLLKKASWLEESLRTGKIPDYMKGERRI